MFKGRPSRSRKTLARAGDHAGAAQVARDYAADDAPAAALFEAARVLSFASSVAKHDENLASVRRDQLADQYACDAVELLTNAGDGGYFDNPRCKHSLETEPDLDALRERDDFRRLLDTAP